ncbi:pyridoxamine 5'-phosphate oxidase family protein [Paenibacillus sp. GSMTC-2017]|uniref:HugZ family pyridoxamine 5'-phosphate oxidase n=1 Tax=Paenibacillus sp. GSMTC-2017 TaxID=2794350 RepID=UPI0018D734F5|nr:pyridoxamine 5'-phosphate oxidase family protein [Paenibacillus sp. GSMTC-2017]MBH5319708.1 pyridoxamine 5'-phosphate oxidase family protein [Paenibacillus sp. GSMTC-2017]
MKALDFDALKEQYLTFTESLKSVMLSTLTSEGKPFISNAPYVMHEGKVYIYISTIAHHFRYLEENPEVDVMLIADEANTQNLFARQRARFVGQAVNLGNEGYSEVFEKFEDRFGKPMIGMLRGLDFSLFELTLSEGRYVAGFGLAFDIDLSGERFEHVARDGHSSSAKK